MKNYFKSGSHNAICDRCGFKFKADQLRKDWQGLMVCKDDYERRHPLDFIRAIPDSPPVLDARDEPADVFAYVCYLEASQGLADIGEADCARADFIIRTRPGDRIEFEFTVGTSQLTIA